MLSHALVSISAKRKRQMCPLTPGPRAILKLAVFYRLTHEQRHGVELRLAQRRRSHLLPSRSAVCRGRKTRPMGLWRCHALSEAAGWIILSRL